MNEDGLVKLGLHSLFGLFVQVHTQFPVQPPAQFVDVFVATETTHPEAMERALGWLGTMGCHLCLIEAFTSDLAIADARHCLRKQLTLHHSLELEAEAQKREGKELVHVPMPWLWMLTWSHPRVLLQGWGMTAMAGWPAGFYGAADELCVGVVVLRELPKTRETLPLRMFGDGEVREGLREEYDRLGEEDPMRQALGQMLVCWQLWLQGNPEDERAARWVMNFEQVVQEQLKKLKEEGRAAGLKEGREALEQMAREAREALERAERESQQAQEHEARQGIEDLCEVLGIELTAARQADLAGRDQAGLASLRLHLKAHRAWP